MVPDLTPDKSIDEQKIFNQKTRIKKPIAKFNRHSFRIPLLTNESCTKLFCFIQQRLPQFEMLIIKARAARPPMHDWLFSDKGSGLESTGIDLKLYKNLQKQTLKKISQQNNNSAKSQKL